MFSSFLTKTLAKFAFLYKIQLFSNEQFLLHYSAGFRKTHKISYYFVDFSKSSGMGEEIVVWLCILYVWLPGRWGWEKRGEIYLGVCTLHLGYIFSSHPSRGVIHIVISFFSTFMINNVSFPRNFFFTKFSLCSRKTPYPQLNRYFFVSFKEKIQNVLNRKNMYLEGYQVI